METFSDGLVAYNLCEPIVLFTNGEKLTLAYQ